MAIYRMESVINNVYKSPNRHYPREFWLWLALNVGLLMTIAGRVAGR